VCEKPSGRRKYLVIASAVVAICAPTVSVEPTGVAAAVGRARVAVDRFREAGTMLRQVRAPGTLVPEHIRMISALTAGRHDGDDVRGARYEVLVDFVPVRA
jgi:HlyD family secretion protein